MELNPGETKRVDIFLGRIEALMKKLQSEGKNVAWVKLFVTAADFADGSRWDPNVPALESPAKLRK